MTEFSFYTLMSAKYYESLNLAPLDPELKRLVTSLLEGEWELSRFETWLRVAPKDCDSLRLQGFKIHVASQVSCAEETLRRVIPILARARVVFKIAASKFVLRFMNSKRYSRAGSGKFLTVYPRSDAQFLELLEELHGVTKGLAGPYILSDKRYKDSGVLSYRYGGFKSVRNIRPDGIKEAMIRTPGGDFVQDLRVPYFYLPEWVTDPFDNSGDEVEGPSLLNSRYEVEEALSFTNTGGVYLALDHETDQKVVIKEARPYIEIMLKEGAKLEAFGALKREYERLQALGGVDFVPRVVEFYSEWEHQFLVTSYFPGIPLAELRAKDDFILIGQFFDEERREHFCATFMVIASRLIAAVEAAHQRGVILGDISPGNVLVDLETLKISIVDLEGAHLQSESDKPSEFSNSWFNPGFRDQERRRLGILDSRDDYYACGMVLYNLLCPIQNMFDLDRDMSILGILNYLSQNGLPEPVAGTIRALLSADAGQARQFVSSIGDDTLIETSVLSELEPMKGSPVDTYSEVAVRELLGKLPSSILESTDTSRTDRLWPADPVVFQTNALNLAHGACGIALFLHSELGELPCDVSAWLLNQPISLETYPPGLFSGVAGIAWSFARMGWIERALDLAGRLPESRLAFAAPDIFYGVAGWGLVCLELYYLTREERFFDLASTAGGHLLKTAKNQGDSIYWEAEGEAVTRLGFGLGSSGISLFLLYLWKLTGREDYLEAGRKGLEFDIRHGQPRPDGGMVWGTTVEDSGHRPYWFRGGAGVASVLIRFHHVLGEDRYLDLAEKAAKGCGSFFVAAPHLFEGLAAIGETMLDMFFFTGRECFLSEAQEKARQCLLFQVDGPNGPAFPGRYLSRISHDFGVGGAGIGLFLRRVLQKGSARMLHDIDMMLIDGRAESTRSAA